MGLVTFQAQSVCMLITTRKINSAFQIPSRFLSPCSIPRILTSTDMNPTKAILLCHRVTQSDDCDSSHAYLNSAHTSNKAFLASGTAICRLLCLSRPPDVQASILGLLIRHTFPYAPHPSPHQGLSTQNEP